MCDFIYHQPSTINHQPSTIIIISIIIMTKKIIILFYQVDASLEDAGGYFQHTGESINVLLVNNFAEMEEVRMVMVMLLVIISVMINVLRWRKSGWS